MSLALKAELDEEHRNRMNHSPAGTIRVSEVPDWHKEKEHVSWDEILGLSEPGEWVNSIDTTYLSRMYRQIFSNKIPEDATVYLCGMNFSDHIKVLDWLETQCVYSRPGPLAIDTTPFMISASDHDVSKSEVFVVYLPFAVNKLDAKNALVVTSGNVRLWPPVGELDCTGRMLTYTGAVPFEIAKEYKLYSQFMNGSPYHLPHVFIKHIPLLSASEQIYPDDALEKLQAMILKKRMSTWSPRWNPDWNNVFAQPIMKHPTKFGDDEVVSAANLLLQRITGASPEISTTVNAGTYTVTWAYRNHVMAVERATTKAAAKILSARKVLSSYHDEPEKFVKFLDSAKALPERCSAELMLLMRDRFGWCPNRPGEVLQILARIGYIADDRLTEVPFHIEPEDLSNVAMLFQYSGWLQGNVVVRTMVVEIAPEIDGYKEKARCLAMEHIVLQSIRHHEIENAQVPDPSAD